MSRGECCGNAPAAAAPAAAPSGSDQQLISRRELLRGLAGYAGLTALGWRPDSGLFKRAPSVVGVARGPSMAESVRTAVNLAGGLDFIAPGQTVLVKPNLCCPQPHPATTSPEVLTAVLELVRESDPGRLIVGDQTFYVQNTVANVQRAGLDDAVRAAGAEFIAFDDVPRRRVRPRGVAHWPNGYRVPTLLEEVDHIINLACIKTHRLARFTMAMKNVIGLIDAGSRRHYHGERRRNPYDLFAAMIAEMCLAMRPTLNILDGTAAFVAGGPASGDRVEPRLIIASTDRIATDVAGLAVLRHHGTEPAIQDHSPWTQPKILHGIDLGLGAPSRSDVALRAEGVAEIDSIKRFME